MQTFLPLPSLGQSIRCLDNKRLGKQRVEAFQILKALRESKCCDSYSCVEYKTTGGAWVNHPATKMWRGYESTLAFYKNLCIEEWVRRGFKNTMEFSKTHLFEMPHWFGIEKFHASHRSNLLRKDSDHYSQYGWEEKNNLPYFWPSPIDLREVECYE